MSYSGFWFITQIYVSVSEGVETELNLQLCQNMRQMKTLDILRRRSETIQSILPSDKMLAFSFNPDLVQNKLS